MSIRSLIEINHDFLREIEGEDARKALGLYIRSANRETADALANHGIKVLGQRHHSGLFYLDGEADGFPVTVVPRRQRPAKSGAHSPSEASAGNPATDEQP